VRFDSRKHYHVFPPRARATTDSTDANIMLADSAEADPASQQDPAGNGVVSES
jgi:Cu2+-containing amine oxidase